MKIKFTLLLIACVFGFAQSSHAATFTVINNTDNATGSLRAAIDSAAIGDTIKFSVTGTITLATNITWNKSLTIIGPGAASLTIDGNNATNMFEMDGGVNHITGLTFNHGSAGEGACILSPPGNQSDSTYIQYCIFKNSIAGDAGGAVSCSNGRILMLDNCTIDSCSAPTNLAGGVISFQGLISNCTFTNCSALYEAGAVWTFGFSTTISNCTFYNNTAPTGAAIFDEMEGSFTLTLINNTFNNNTATTGGSCLAGQIMPGPLSGLTIYFQNNLFAGGSNFYLNNTNGFVGTSLGGNVSSDNTLAAYLTAGTDKNTTPPGFVTGVPANNGGFTKTIALQCSSLAVNNGISAGAPTTDQRGAIRVGLPDAGSYEFNSPLSNIQNVSICPGDSLIVGTSVYTTTGLYQDVLISVGGCDSTVTTNLSLYSAPSISQTVAVCAGDTFTIAGHSYTHSGNFTDTLNTVHGCDSIITTHLTVRTPITSFSGNTFCGSASLTVGSHTYTHAGTYTDTLTSAVGCDSVITTVIIINPVDTTIQSATLCAGDSIIVGNSVYKNSGTYTDHLSNLNTCDSMVVTHLTVAAPLVSAQAFNICANDSVVVGTSIYKTAGTFTNVFTASTGCDSTVSTTVTIRPAATGSQTLQICHGGSVTINGNLYTAAGTYTDTLTSHNGCDSILTTVLTVFQVDTAVILTGNTLVANSGQGKTFQWFDCDNNQPVIGATLQTFTPGHTGNFAVVETQNQCPDTSACYHVIVAGIENLSANMGINIYPNPTNNTVTVQMQNTITNGNLRLLNLFGQVLQQQAIGTNSKLEINMSAYAAGIYIIEVSDNNITTQSRVVKN